MLLLLLPMWPTPLLPRLIAPPLPEPEPCPEPEPEPPALVALKAAQRRDNGDDNAPAAARPTLSKISPTLSSRQLLLLPPQQRRVALTGVVRAAEDVERIEVPLRAISRRCRTY